MEYREAEIDAQKKEEATQAEMARILDEGQQREEMDEDEMERLAQQQETVEAYKKIEEKEILVQEI